MHYNTMASFSEFIENNPNQFKTSPRASPTNFIFIFGKIKAHAIGYICPQRTKEQGGNINLPNIPV